MPRSPDGDGDGCRVPHRSGRAELPHPALQAHGFATRRRTAAHRLVVVSASPAIRCSLVWMVPRFDAPSIFPSIGSMPRRPLPSSGSLSVRFPGLVGTMRRSDFLKSIPGGSLTRLPVPSSRCLLRSRRRPARPSTGLGFGLPVPLPASSGRRQQDLPSSRQFLSMHALLSPDPGGTGAPGHSAPAMLPSARDTASAPTNR